MQLVLKHLISSCNATCIVSPFDLHRTPKFDFNPEINKNRKKLCATVCNDGARHTKICSDQIVKP